MRANALSSTLYVIILLTNFLPVVNAYHSRRGHGLYRRDNGPDPLSGDSWFDIFNHHHRSPKKQSPPKQQQPPPESKPTSTPSQSSNPLDLSNMQADYVFPITMQAKTFFFFKINNSTTFKKALGNSISARITTAAQAAPGANLSTPVINMGFTIDGLDSLAVTDDLGDPSFKSRQINDVNAMGDPGTSNWVQQFTTQDIHGVFIVAANSQNDVNGTISNLMSTSGGSISQVYRLDGLQRPGDLAGREYFEFKDGLSSPCLKGLMDCSQPGVTVVPAGEIILGGDGDGVSRPSWARGGSMLVFRQLQEFAPEFHKSALDNAIKMPGMTTEQGAELLKARMFGRWPDGTPLELSPLKADPVLAADRLRNNNFTYSRPGSDLSSDQSGCPFSAHIRKCNPRNDLPNNSNHIVRSSIVYGGEVTPEETAAQKTSQERGLAFGAYQSLISQGFLFQQKSWLNNPNFPPNKNQTIGFDPIAGANHGQPRQVSGLDPTDIQKSLSLPEFVRSRGGAYFFIPPKSALVNGGKLTE